MKQNKNWDDLDINDPDFDPTIKPKNNTHVELKDLFKGEEDLEVIKDAVYRAYDYLFALGHFTTPTNEGRIVENLLIQARVRILTVIQKSQKANPTL